MAQLSFDCPANVSPDLWTKLEPIFNKYGTGPVVLAVIAEYKRATDAALHPCDNALVVNNRLQLAKQAIETGQEGE